LPDKQFLAVGRDFGSAPEVSVFNVDGTFRYAFTAYAPWFTGGVRVAVGDVTGDGVANIVTAPGPGMAGLVRVFDTRTGMILAEFIPFEVTFTGGVYIAVGDVTGDGIADIIVGAGDGGGPRVRVFRGPHFEFAREFFAYEETFRGGVLVAVGDITGDGIADIITGTGVGGGPRVQVFDGATGALRYNFFAYEESFRGGVFAAIGDMTGDGIAEIITGTGVGGGPAVRVFRQVDLLRGQDTPTPHQSFFAFDPSFRGGVRVDALDLTRDGTREIIATPGPGGPPVVRVIRATGPIDDPLDLIPFSTDLPTGVFVGSG
jgi:hypothetical protein